MKKEERCRIDEFLENWRDGDISDLDDSEISLTLDEVNDALCKYHDNFSKRLREEGKCLLNEFRSNGYSPEAIQAVETFYKQLRKNI